MILVALVFLNRETQQPSVVTAPSSDSPARDSGAVAELAPQRDEVPTTGEPARPADSARLWFLDASDRSSVAGLRVRLQAPDGPIREFITDVNGAANVPRGRWSVTSTRSDVEIQDSVVELDPADDRIVWVSRTFACRVVVRDEVGQPIAAACVSIEREGHRGQPHRGVTDALGVVVLPTVPTAFDGSVVVWRAGYSPAQVPVAAIDPITRDLVVVLARNFGEGVTLECIDDLARPVPGVSVQLLTTLYGERSVWLGTTDEAGRLDLGSLAGRLPGEFWLRGPILTTRLRLDAEPSASPLRAKVCVPVRGTLTLASRALVVGERIDVRVVDAGVDANAARLNKVGTWILATAHGLPIDLPRNREVKITCFDAFGRQWGGTYRAEHVGWQQALPSCDPIGACRLDLIAHGAALGRVTSRIPYQTESDGRVATVHVPRGPVSFQVESSAPEGARLAFDGVIHDDVVVDVRFPLVQRVDLMVVDERGHAMPDVLVELRRTSHLAREPVAGTDLMQFRSNNTLVLAPDANGGTSAVVMEGTYEVVLRHLGFRDLIGTWRPRSGGVFTVPGPGRLTVESERPRRVVFTIDATFGLPARWQVHDRDGALLGAQHGRVGVLWCSAAEQTVEIRGPGGGEALARFDIPPSEDETRLQLGSETLRR